MSITLVWVGMGSFRHLVRILKQLNTKHTQYYTNFHRRQPATPIHSFFPKVSLHEMVSWMKSHREKLDLMDWKSKSAVSCSKRKKPGHWYDRQEEKTTIYIIKKIQLTVLLCAFFYVSRLLQISSTMFWVLNIWKLSCWFQTVSKNFIKYVTFLFSILILWGFIPNLCASNCFLQCAIEFQTVNHMVPSDSLHRIFWYHSM